jgi:E3 Ubiquitin ligase
MQPLAVVFMSVHATSNDTAKLGFWAAVGAVFGVVLFVRGFQMLRFKRLIMNTPASKIRSASMGLVEISGMAKGPSTITAGITGEACYYYRAIAWQLRQSGRNREWKQVASESLYVPFFVKDPTGQLLIDPQGADFDIERNFKDEFDTSLFSSNRKMLPENVSSFLLRNGVSFSESTRLEEYCIKPDHPLFVFGTLCTDSDPLTWSPTPHLGSGTSLHARLNFLGSGGGALGWFGLTSGNVTFSGGTAGTGGIPAIVQAMATPKPNAAPAPASWSEVSMDEVGERSPAAAQADESQFTSVGVAAADPDPASQAASPDAQSDSGFNMHPSVCLSKGADGNPFMISCRSQRDLVQSLAWKSALCIWGGPALTLASLYVLALRLGWG